MSNGKSFDANQVEQELLAIAGKIRDVARGYQGDNLSLLALLRMLESLHQEIRDGIFQDSLPDNRQALYNLLKDIEATGGWPYIHRMKLQLLLKNFPVASDSDADVLTALFSETSQPVDRKRRND